MTKISEILDRAADIIVGRGWTKQTVEDSYGRVCQLGAVRIAVDGDTFDRMNPIVYEVEKFLEKIVGHDPVYWNDSVVSDKGTIIGTLRDAAEIARLRGES